MPQLFDKVLVANRGEIAVRIIRACRALGIKTVTVFSTADTYAVHTLMGDESYEIGPPPPLESYLNIDKLIETAKKSGAQAIHPGYGFLAENPRFSQACRDNGLVFIGPSPESILLMGNKVESRIKMAGAGVPLIPGMKAAGNHIDEFRKVADEAGYPVLIKAAAGGGGKGMRVVKDPADLQTAVDGARREAKSAFGDDTVYLEKYIVNPRHIEFQVLADHHGKTIHLFERECSIQRRHQKIVEETPSTAVSPELRKKMGDAAVAVAQAADYTNAGTVEFLLDPKGKFYFLEMNTRIQVEHPVTELVAGVDLVAEQIRIAAGFPMSDSFCNLHQRGHAIECRIYAEDAANNFMPSIGKIVLYREPTGPGVRVDSGIAQGSVVGIDYDPILAKLIVWGQDRDTARARMVRALHEYKILGIRQSIRYLADIVAHPKFAEGETYTDFIERNFSDWEEKTEEHLDLALAAAAAINANGKRHHGAIGGKSEAVYNPWLTMGAWRIGEKDKMMYEFVYKGETRTVDFKDNRIATIAGSGASLQIEYTADGRLLLRDGALLKEIHAAVSGDKTYVDIDGVLFEFAKPSDAIGAGGGGGAAMTDPSKVLAPMPGKVVKILVGVGDTVEPKQHLVIVEAMKMENIIVAHAKGKVKAVNYAEGAQCDTETPIVELELEG